MKFTKKLQTVTCLAVRNLYHTLEYFLYLCEAVIESYSYLGHSIQFV